MHGRSPLAADVVGYYAPLMISLATFVELRVQRHTLGLYCVVCDRWSDADLPRLIARGYGDREVVNTRFRCRDCGAVAEKQVRPPAPQAQSAVPYIGGGHETSPGEF